MPRRFNPRPAHASGATYFRLPKIGHRCGFNPRPAHASGATYQTSLPPLCLFVSIRAPLTRAGRRAPVRAIGQEIWVSIRAPLTRAGRLKRLREMVSLIRVSIRAPLTRAGRHTACVLNPESMPFQSAPRSRERGDCGRFITLSRKGFVGVGREPVENCLIQA